MDFHILIVIGCVFGASLLSFLFINKIFRRKTFEEVVAEKRAMSANLYAQNKSAGSNPASQRKPKKKELKREKKQRQREQQKDNASQEDQDDFSDGGHSEEQGSVQLEEESSQPGLSKQHVEFEPDPEVMNDHHHHQQQQQRRPSNAEKENHPSNNNNNNNNNNISGKKNKKDKRNGAGGAKSAPVVGILVNKNDVIAVRQTPVDETPVLNNFEVRVPKDVVELKKQEHNNNSKQQQQQQAQKRNGGPAKKEKPTLISAALEQAVEVPHVPKQAAAPKQQQHQTSGGSPKQVQHKQAKQQQQQQPGNKRQKDTMLTAKDLVQALDKLAEHQTIGVSALMNVFARAELNRSEIQILIDYLLNKQQDMPANHGEWSDDICQKLKRQLEEKEKLLAEEQEASSGIQAKLRELRQEINTERAQIHSRSQAYNEKLLGKDQELTALNQELASANEKLALERQQFQAKLMCEKQLRVDMLPQLQRLQQDLAHKEKIIADMTSFVNAEAHAETELIQQQAQQIMTLEQQRDELEARLNNSVFELEQRKQLETENSELKVELRNLNNALESAGADLTHSQSELARVRNTELQELRQQTVSLEASNVSLNKQLSKANSHAVQVSALQSEQAQAQSETLIALQAKLRTLNDAQATQRQQTSALHTQLEEAQQRAEQLQHKEQQLQLELHEQREKNNDVRMKNWKLIEALQNAEATRTTTRTAKTKTNTAQTTSLGQQHNQLQEQQQQLQQQQQQQKATAAANGGGELRAAATTGSIKAEQQRIRELYQRLYPDAVKAHAATALNASFDEWLEQVLLTHIKQQQQQQPAAAISSSNKSTQSNNNSSSSSSDHNSTSSSSSTHNNISSNNSNSNSKSFSSSSGSAVEQQELHTQNLKLRKRNDELTQLVTKTSNTLVDLEQRAREQDEHWRGIVSQKEQLISKLQQHHASNGEQDI
ncbi:ribosome-binding protein 1 isoform X1 [Drosophila grimshawi]|uniref:GH19521 n=1 Tax=Drosophila grimshawi TaxID=7222 RepID=B4JH05_DROGR|nr:ribosome-binding protein 1 isoform X1 [Drosophila grimshawi]XP_032593623.1 ribosome-binding protein 1 isoform X1 [Drosophila grimshawi]XP_032593624.1 ribosome-binding protein 1 isoform X1 [Drosophila grimshawi]EDV93783.1 GH19521 [Drosophila grimshawi]